MAVGNNNAGTRGAARSLLSRREWVYLLSLLVPFAVYDLVLKGVLVFAGSGDPGFLGGLDLMRSDLLFNLGYALLWVGLFALARRRASRWIVVGMFHVVTMLVALITTSAYQYYKVTGSTLDSDYLYLWLASPEGTGGAIASELTPGILALLLIVVFYAALGPALVTRLVLRWRGPSGAAPRTSMGVSWIRIVGVGLAAYALFSLSLLPGGSSTGASKSFSRDAFVNVVMTAAQVAESEELPEIAAEPVAENPPAEASLTPTADTEKRNVVMIQLESTRARATTPYNENLDTTPFLDELAKQSLLVEQAYTVVPHTHNALAAINCGVEPPLDHWGTMVLGVHADSMPSQCLPDLLGEQGYNSAYFMSQRANFERSPQILENLGYKEFYSTEVMDTEGFEQTNYFGYEDEVMLEPSQKWLEQQKKSGEPFVASYLTSAPHHDYLAPSERHGKEDFTNNELVNRYLNSVRNQDYFLKQLIDQYKKLGLYDDTVFIILGDHGEAFGEHGRFQHDNVIYEEGLRIPLLVHDPKYIQSGATLEGPVNQLDILPTVTDLLDYEVRGGTYGGSSLVRPMRKDRTLMFSCWYARACLASLKGKEKYIYHFEDQPEEVFDLSQDPNELQNLAGQRSPEELEKRRRELLEWRAKVNSNYGMQSSE
jgi:phosphoglycerol transferase MdoB-like AlkP superfamily enzyme